MGLTRRFAGHRVYLDANVFIYAVEGAPAFAGTLPPLLAAIARGEQEAVTSEITLAEVLVHPIRDADAEREASFVRSVRTRGGLAVVPVSRAVLVEAAHLRATTQLKLPDAIHAATARLAGCSVLLTNDTGIATVPGVEVVRLSDVIVHG